MCALLAALALLSACAREEPVETGDPVAKDFTAAVPAGGETPEPEASVTAARSGTPVLAIDGDGLRLVDPERGSARPLVFGTPRAAVLAALADRSAPETGRQAECGAGPLDFAEWPDGLRLYFQDRAFRGWALGGRGRKPELSTMSGLAIGSLRAALEAAYDARIFESTLGTEFTAGALSGLLDGPGKGAQVTHLWAGVSCNFR